MALTVVVRSGDQPKPLKISFDAPRIVIGRGDGCEVRLPDPSVSHRHATVRQRGADYVVVDEGSTNGTFVGPVRLSPQAPRVVRSGDLVRVGRVWLELLIEAVPVTESPQLATREIALALVSAALAAQGEAAAVKLRVSAGPDTGKELALTEFDREYVIGRAQGIDLTLTDPDTSRRHVGVTRRGPSLFVHDLGSKNGARVAGQPIASGGETIWPRCAAVSFGATELQYDDPVSEALQEIEASADEQMRSSDDVEPPAGLPAPELSLPRSETAAAPVVRVPTQTRKPAAAQRGFRSVDLVIALFALAVLAASLAGLMWLFE
jgi:pSer/pThr/pTyr-binding forkhead associated (FHA) protein